MCQILIVEDSRADAAWLERALRNAGICNPIHNVWNGAEAILYLAEFESALTVKTRRAP